MRAAEIFLVLNEFFFLRMIVRASEKKIVFLAIKKKIAERESLLISAVCT
jgi:hypothetical protein